jgi:hypothetical protein
MEIYKIPACWPSSFLYGIPIAGIITNIDMLLKENLIDNQNKPNKQSLVQLDRNLIDFIFQFCSVMKV